MGEVHLFLKPFLKKVELTTLCVCKAKLVILQTNPNNKEKKNLSL